MLPLFQKSEIRKEEENPTSNHSVTLGDKGNMYTAELFAHNDRLTLHIDENV